MRYGGKASGERRTRKAGRRTRTTTRHGVGGAEDNLVAKKAVSRARDDDEGIREGQGNTIVNGVIASNKDVTHDDVPEDDVPEDDVARDDDDNAKLAFANDDVAENHTSGDVAVNIVSKLKCIDDIGCLQLIDKI
ncbi:hypothetical protein Dimus_013878 [Dionaea muscipula]